MHHWIVTIVKLMTKAGAILTSGIILSHWCVSGRASQWTIYLSTVPMGQQCLPHARDQNKLVGSNIEHSFLFLCYLR